MSSERPLRSVLYIPASKVRALDKAATLETDAIIFDLEDAVSPDEKEAARDLLVQKLTENDYGTRTKIVRINGLDTEWGRRDAEAIKDCDIDAVLLPKVETTEQLDALAGLVNDLPLWAMMETPNGVLNAGALAAHLRMNGFVMGTNDLAKDLGCRYHKDRMPMLTSLQLCLLAARGAGIAAIDGVYNAFRDDDGLLHECTQGRDMGFDGKTLIHPLQLGIANAAFAPSDAEVDLAKRQIEAFEAALASGEGVAVVDGAIVENLHVVTARATLAKVAAIEALAA